MRRKSRIIFKESKVDVYLKKYAINSSMSEKEENAEIQREDRIY